MVRGNGPHPSVVLAYIDRLPLGSKYMSERLAKEMGGNWRDFLDKGVDWWLTADLYDALNQNTRASGNFKKPPKIEPYPRPGKGKKKPKSLKDVVKLLGGPTEPTSEMWTKF